MCSVNPDIDEDDTNNLMPVVEPLRSATVCRKCKEVDSVVVLQSKFPYCRTCFIEVVSHKFFGCLGKSKLMKPSDRVLVLCSGSQSSSVLLNLIKIGLYERHKKILSQAVVLFIDAGDFLPLSINERMDLIKEIKEMVSHFGFKSYYSPILYSENCLKDLDDLGWCTPEYLEGISLKQIIGSLKTSTAKEDLLIKMRSTLAVQVARDLECNKIFSGETNDHTAAKILTNIALGRGDQLPLDIGFSDNRFNDLIILRPLRDCSRKEIAFYRLLFDLPYVSYQKGGSMKGKDESIQKLTEKFVAELQVSFPSTVCMVVGTGNKLGIKQGTHESEDICALCRGNKTNFKENEMSAVSATQVSRLISNLGSQGFDSANLTNIEDTTCGDNQCNKECRCTYSNKNVDFEKIKYAFCYGCQLILNDMRSLDCLPRDIINDAEHKLKLKAMRQEIDDFLL